MRVLCVNKIADSLPQTAYDPLYGITEETEYPVTPGRHYVVFAVTQWLGLAWYYIIDDDAPEWPIWRPASLFQVSDGSLPPNWKFGFFMFSRDDQIPVLSFPEWAEDYHFYERLVDDGAEEVAVFSKRRAEIEAFDSRSRGGEPG